MAFELEIFDDRELSESFIEWLVDERSVDIQNHFGRLWDYYQNQSKRLSSTGLDVNTNESARMYIQAQEYGLPSRITGIIHIPDGDVFSGRAAGDLRRKEVVIENDITWRYYI